MDSLDGTVLEAAPYCTPRMAANSLAHAHLLDAFRTAALLDLDT